MSLFEERPVVFTAQSKRYFYCRDAVSAFVIERGCVPLNPFRVFEYFLHDRVSRDDVRVGNFNLIRISDELWSFGNSIADGVLAEIEYSRSLGKPIRFFTIDTRADVIRQISPESLSFELELYRGGSSKASLLRRALGIPDQEERLFDEDIE